MAKEHDSHPSRLVPQERMNMINDVLCDPLLYSEEFKYWLMKFLKVHRAVDKIGAGGHIIEDEGSALTQRTYLDFVGAGVTATDDSINDKTIVTIPSTTGGHIIEDEGTPLTQRADLNFVGSGVTAADSGGVTVVTIPGGGFFGIPDQSVGYWYTCPFTKPGSSATPLNGVLHATPFIVTRTTTYDRIGVICSSAQTGSAYRFGIYTNSNGYPAALVLDAGTVATTSTGERSITISQQLTAGFYWLVAASQTSGSSATVSGGVIPYLFSTSTSLATADASGNGGGGAARVLTGVTAALADPFTASAAWIGSGSAATPFLRVASVP